MKKLLAMLLALVMVLSMAACGEKADPTDAPKQTDALKQTDAPEQTDPVVPSEPVHINFWVCGQIGNLSEKPGTEAVIAAMNEYSKEKINVTFDFTSTDDDKVQMELATSDTIDMFWANTLNWDQLITQGAVMDITDLLPNYPTLVESIPELVWKSTEYDGSRYVVPIMKESFTGGTYIFPKEMADKVKASTGIDVNEIKVETFRDFGKLTDYLQAVVDMDDTALGVVKTFTFDNMMGYDPTYSVVFSGVGLDASTGKIVDLYATKEYADYVALMHDWNQRGFFHDELAVGNLKGSKMNEWRKTGNYGMTQWVTTPDNLNNAAVRYDGIEVYGIEFGERQTGSQTMLKSDFAISAKSDKAEACLKLIELILTDPVMADLYAFGIEGVNYTRNADGTVARIADSGYSVDVWCASSVFTASLVEGESLNKKELYAADNAAAVASPTMGFRFNSDKVAAEGSALSNVTSEYTHLLEYGFYDPAEQLSKFLDARKAAGVDNIIAEMQAQYDAWKASK